MSDNAGGPVRRRRIAGESPSGAAAKKSVAKKAATKKAPIKKAPAVKAPLAKKAAAKKTPTAKKKAANKTVTTAPPAQKAAPTPVAKKAAAKKTPAVKKTAAAAAAAPATRVVQRPPRPARPAVDPEKPARARATLTKPPRRELRWLVPAVVLAVAVLVVGTVLAVRGVSEVSGGQDLASSERQASSAAGSAAETIFSFQYDKLDQHLTESKALMTPAFAKSFDKIAPALTELAPQRKIQVKAVTRNAAAVSCGDECSDAKANVLVFVDQARLVGGSEEPTVFGNRISVSMVKVDGSWLVNDIRAL